jgi:hypothetical protein
MAVVATRTVVTGRPDGFAGDEMMGSEAIKIL